MTEAPPGRDFGRFLKPDLHRRLEALGMDVVYHRAQGDHLYLQEGGREIEILDMVGGFGAGLLGHNHPYIVAAATRALTEERPFLAQGSVRAEAARLARRLSERIGRVTGRAYWITLANSGTEAVEVALKHAELERRNRIRERSAEMRRDFAHLEERLALGTATLPEGFLARAAAELGLPHLETLDALSAALDARLLGLETSPPVALALRGAFHGKTLGALQLTYNPSFRKPWEGLGPRVRFLDPESSDGFGEVLHDERVSYGAMEVGPDGVVGLVERHLVNVLACFAEPIQGEGGVRPLSRSCLEALRALADEGDFPLVLDEIQSGMGRTGTFLASEPSGVRGDYYTLAKALGGGVAKISALAVGRERYVQGFDSLHSSTYADDHAASAVANAVLDCLEENEGELLALARAKGDHLLERLRALQERYPDQLEAIRGRGLFVGVQLASQERSPSRLLRVVSEQDRLGSLVCGYLLAEHRIRALPTLSSGGTLRIQPSVYVDLTELNRFCDALEDVLAALRHGGAHRLTRHIAGGGVPDRRPEAVSSGPAPEADSIPEPTTGRVGFLGHFVEPGDLRRWDPTLAAFSDAECNRFLRRTRGLVHPFVTDRSIVRSVTGATVTATTIALPCTSAQAEEAMRSGEDGWLHEWIDEALDLARAEGCTVVGFGGFTSIATRNCRTVYAPDLAVTTGNGLTAAAALEATLRAADRLGIEHRRLGVVGSAGNIGRILAEVAAPRVHELVLVGRGPARSRLQTLAAALELHGPVRVGEGMHELRECNLIISATNSIQPVILPEHVHPSRPVVVTDVALPGDVDPGLEEARPEATVLRGGIIRAPRGQDLTVGGTGLDPGELYGCLAETLLLGLEGSGESLSRGTLRAEVVQRAGELARRHGFSIDEPLQR